MRILRELLYESKHSKKVTERVFSFRMIVSFAIIFLSMAAMSLTAYAYFSAEESSTSNHIASTKYELDMAVTCDGAEVPLANNSFSLESGKVYSVSLSYVEGFAKTGFCGVKIGDIVYHTVQLGTDQEAPDGKRYDLSFKFIVEGTGTATAQLIPHWGTSSFYDGFSKNEELYISQGKEVPVTLLEGVALSPVKITYTVAEGDTLSAIAKTYDTTVERIVVYNELESSDLLYAGQEIVIPPAAWQMPETNTLADPATDTETPSETADTTTPAAVPDSTAPTAAAPAEVPDETTTTADTSTETTVADPVEATDTETTVVDPVETTNTETTEQAPPAAETTESVDTSATEASE